MSVHRLCDPADVPSGEARRYDVGACPIAVVRIDDDYYAVGDTCTHQRVSLSEGEVHTDTRQIECWKHGSTFSLLTGEPDSLPAIKPTPVYPVTVEGDDLFVELPDD